MVVLLESLVVDLLASQEQSQMLVFLEEARPACLVAVDPAYQEACPRVCLVAVQRECLGAS